MAERRDEKSGKIKNKSVCSVCLDKSSCYRYSKFLKKIGGVDKMGDLS